MHLDTIVNIRSHDLILISYSPWVHTNNTSCLWDSQATSRLFDTWRIWGNFKSQMYLNINAHTSTWSIFKLKSAEVAHQILNLRQNRACCLWHTLSLREGFLLDNCERWRSRRCFSMGRKSPPLCSSALQTPEIETIIFQWHNLVATFRIITFFVKQVAFIQFCTAFKILSEWRKKTYFSINLVDIFSRRSWRRSWTTWRAP